MPRAKALRRAAAGAAHAPCRVVGKDDSKATAPTPRLQPASRSVARHLVDGKWLPLSPPTAMATALLRPLRTARRVVKKEGSNES